MRKSVLVHRGVACAAALLWAFLGTTSSGEAEMPIGLWRAFSDARHEVEEAPGGGELTAQNPANDLIFRFNDGGLTVEPGVVGSHWRLSMSLAAWGQDGGMTRVKGVEPVADGRRVELRRDGLTEWFVNRDRGLEHGFTVHRPAGYDPEAPLVVELELSGGLTARLDGDRQGVSFAAPSGGYAFDYDELDVVDADGNELSGRLGLTVDGMEIRVDVGHASWPVTIDPVISSECTLAAFFDDAEAQDQFGRSVSVRSPATAPWTAVD
jgi:hypothetical protein